MKNTKLNFALLCVAFTFTGITSFAGGIADKATQKGYMDTAKDDIASAEKACGTKLNFTIDMSEYKAADWSGRGPSCAQVLDAVTSICNDANYKEALVKHVKAIKCFPSNKGEVKLKGTTLEYRSPFGDGTVFDEAVKKYLKTAIDT